MLAGFVPTMVGGSDVSAAARVVAFDVTVPAASNASVTRWDKLPAFSDGYAPASAATAARVQTLVDELERAAKKQ